MKKTLTSIEPLKTGLILGIICGVGSLVFLVPMGLFFFATVLMNTTQSSGMNIGGAIGAAAGIILLMPLAYAVSGFLTGALGSWLYNIVASWVGGIQIEVE